MLLAAASGAVAANCIAAETETATAESLYRVLPAGEPPADARLKPLTTLRTGYFPFTPPETQAEWADRSRTLRTQVLVAAGLWPMPPRPAPRAVVHGAVDRGDYVVEKVYLESYPGHFVTGNLYRPADSAAGPPRRPAVLSPYGHWPGGRFQDLGEEGVAKQIAQGAERYPRGGRYPLQARCVQLARMGCVVFLFDAEGYGDSQQIPDQVAHAIKEPRPDREGPDEYGFFSTQAELRLQSIYGLQGYNALAALDWLASRDDVDPQRIGVTGGSGGATQTMFLCAADPRPAAAFEAVMVSTAMQGGCPCENACDLRTVVGNVGIAALMAPKPLGMASANDWTVELHEKGYPELQQLYRVLGQPENVYLANLTQFPHNYNYATRAAMYEWFNTHLQLDCESPIVEQDFEPLSVDELTVWNEEHPAPPGGFEHERAVLQAMTEQSERALAKLTPRDAPSALRYEEAMHEVYQALLGPAPRADDCSLKVVRRLPDRGDVQVELCLATDSARGAELPVVRLRPAAFDGRWVVWTDAQGKSGLFGDDGEFRPGVRDLLNAGIAVAGVDALGQGELAAGATPAGENRQVDEERRLAAFTYGYNRPLLAHRAGDLVAVAWALDPSSPPDKRQVGLLASAEACPYAAAALAMRPAAFGAAAIETGGFRFANLKSWKDADFFAGAVKYRDLAGLLSMASPRPLLLVGDNRDALPLVADAYAAGAAADAFETQPAGAGTGAETMAKWLVENLP